MSTSKADPAFDTTVDVVVVGSGAGGMTAALTASHAGLDVLITEKAPVFGGTTALSGGGIWAPGADALVRDGYEPDPEGVLKYLQTITDGLVSDDRLLAYVEQTPKMIDFLEGLSKQLQFVWKPGYPDYYPSLPGATALGCTVNVQPIDLRRLGEDEKTLIPPPALAPRGIYLGPKELKDFYTIRQSWRGKRILLRLLWRMIRARITGERIVAIGQSLAARLRLALGEQDVPLWLSSPMTSLITADNGTVIGVEIEREGRVQTIRARRGVLLATGGFDHDILMRTTYEPVIDKDWSLGNAAAEGDGIKVGEKIGADVDLMDEAWWFPAIQWPDGRMQFMLNERMIPGQFVVNGEGKRFVNEAAPYTDFGHAVIAGQRTGVQHIPAWLIIDARSWQRYVFAGHLPLPKIPFAPVPTGRKVPKSWFDAGVVKSGRTWADLARQIDVPADELLRTAERFNGFARQNRDEDFHRGESAYDNYYGDARLPNPNLAVVDKAPFYAFAIYPGDLGTNGGLVTDANARVLRGDGSAIPGLYATGNTAASVMGRSYAGAGATIGPSMTFGYIAVHHMASAAASADDPARDHEEVKP